MKTAISPKDLAEAIGVSESSIKRWVDQGALAATRTAGGHRRIMREEALRFIRANHQSLARPDKLGLEEVAATYARTPSLSHAADDLEAHLAAGREREVSGLIVGLFLGGHAVAAIADEVIEPAMGRIGRLRHGGQAGIFVERRATMICAGAVSELRTVQRESGVVPRRTAIVAAPEDDHEQLAPALLSLTLVDAGWRVVSLGPDTPLAVVSIGAQEVGARLVALSITASLPPSRHSDLEDLIAGAASQDRWVALGGRAMPALAARPYLLMCRALTDLAGAVRLI